MSTAAVVAPVGRRELGRVDRGRVGPTLLVVAGIHGNEPAGVSAVARVLGRLRELDLALDGRLVALAGNPPALGLGQRYIARDLNRQWTAAAIARLVARDPATDSSEDREQRALLQSFREVIDTARGPVVFVDLHTSSADGPPFLCFADTIANRRVGFATRVPIILGIEETLDGAALEWFSERGIVSLAIEGGRHDHPDTVGNHEAVLWLLLEHLGLLRRGEVDMTPHVAHLERATAGVPSIVEILYRHAIAQSDEFRMLPGFTNFQPVAKGQVLAHDRRGEIRAKRPCRVMLPLYQALGDDGFFLARDVRPIWLGVASWLRTLGLQRIVHWLPGVRRDPGDPHTILVNPAVARWFVTEIFHLLGFRRERRCGDQLAFTRRWSLRENRRLGPRA
jgi:succinylglutamate desuccinylase